MYGHDQPVKIGVVLNVHPMVTVIKPRAFYMSRDIGKTQEMWSNIGMKMS